MEIKKELFMSGDIADANSRIGDMYFTLNKKCDNLMDYLDVSLMMNKLANAIHVISHKFPLEADLFRDYNAIYGYRTMYRTIEGQTTEFPSVMDGITDILEYISKTSDAISDAKKLGERQDNYDYVAFIFKQMERLRTYKDQFILLYDKVSQALKDGENLQSIDHRFEDYIIITGDLAKVDDVIDN